MIKENNNIDMTDWRQFLKHSYKTVINNELGDGEIYLEKDSLEDFVEMVAKAERQKGRDEVVFFIRDNHDVLIEAMTITQVEEFAEILNKARNPKK